MTRRAGGAAPLPACRAVAAEGTSRRTLLLAAAGVLPLLAAAPAAAAPLHPGEDQVEAARAAAEGAAARVAALQAELARQQADLDAAHVRLSVAVEDHHEADALLQQRAADAARAAGAADAARAELAGAREALGHLASSSYRSAAGELGPLASVLAGGSTQDLLDRSATLARLTARRDDAVTRAGEAQRRAETTRAEAEAAAGAQRRATEAAAAARAAAEEAAAGAEALLAATRARTEQTLAELAQLRSTSVELERQRQAALVAEEEARREAAARAGLTGVTGAAEPVPAAAGPTPGADTAVAWALAQLGKPYRWGGEGPDAFDCSGLTQRAWEAAGVRLPHSSRLQFSGEAKVALADLRAGDLVFYATDTADPSTVHHVGVVVSPGRMVEAPHTGAVVRTASIYRSGLLAQGTRPS
ncbi:C40 family peptidase [Kineococcus sp. SYSU DK018]|uniref:C40 family peptidase n=1 Tax=Kineococcus sp. SYSU DK018 TaxID=3383139 RepID=UPI003D7C8AAA